VDLFTDEAEVIAIGSGLLLIAACTTHAQTRQVIISGCLRGAGDTKYVALMSFISIGVLRPISAYLLCYPIGLGVYGAWISLVLDQVLRMVLGSIRFKSGKWALKKL